MTRKHMCDLRDGWPDCWNTECRWHGTVAKEWHSLVALGRERQLTKAEQDRLSEILPELSQEPRQKDGRKIGQHTPKPARPPYVGVRLPDGRLECPECAGEGQPDGHKCPARD